MSAHFPSGQSKATERPEVLRAEGEEEAGNLSSAGTAWQPPGSQAEKP